MSTTTSLKQNDENVPHFAKEKAILQAKSSSERKTLKTLQVGSDGKLLGIEKPKPLAKQIHLSKKPVKVFIDKPKSWLETGTQTDRATLHESGVQTEISGAIGSPITTLSEPHNDSGVGAGDIDEEAYDLMVKDPIPESYWKDIAEERRASLAEALSENEMLHQSMEEIREENHNLSLLASQAEYLASVLNDVLGDGKDKEEEEETDDKVTEESTNPTKTEVAKEDNTTTAPKPEDKKEDMAADTKDQ